jgi:hypothetical protein
MITSKATELSVCNSNNQQKAYSTRINHLSLITIIINNLSSPDQVSANRSSVLIPIILRHNVNDFIQHTRRSKVRHTLLALLGNIVLSKQIESVFLRRIVSKRQRTRGKLYRCVAANDKVVEFGVGLVFVIMAFFAGCVCGAEIDALSGEA